MVYRLTISYRGRRYAGWQRQPNALAVQQVVEEAFRDLLGAACPIVGASRTDAGVHARGQVAHLEPPRPFPLSGLVHGANQRLPEDVRVMRAERVADGFHARKCASAKEYRYRLVRSPVLSALDLPTAIRVEGSVDVDLLRRAVAALVGEHDFTAFALSGGSHAQPVRRILVAEWVEAGERLTLRLVGSGFLRGMVRSLAGTLLEVGLGRRSVDSFVALLAGRPRSEAGPTAPARALILQRVDYPERWRALPEEAEDVALDVLD